MSAALGRRGELSEQQKLCAAFAVDDLPFHYERFKYRAMAVIVRNMLPTGINLADANFDKTYCGILDNGYAGKTGKVWAIKPKQSTIA